MLDSGSEKSVPVAARDGPTFRHSSPRWELHSTPAVFVVLKIPHRYHSHFFPRVLSKEICFRPSFSSMNYSVFPLICVRLHLCGRHLVRSGADLTPHPSLEGRAWLESKVTSMRLENTIPSDKDHGESKRPSTKHQGVLDIVQSPKLDSPTLCFDSFWLNSNQSSSCQSLPVDVNSPTPSMFRSTTDLEPRPGLTHRTALNNREQHHGWRRLDATKTVSSPPPVDLGLGGSLSRESISCRPQP